MTIKQTTTGRASLEAGLNILVYGQSGAGKTRLAATTKEPTLIISSENKTLSLQEFDLPVIVVETLADIKEVLQALEDPNNKDFQKFKWIVIDSLSDIAEVALSSLKKQYADGRQAYGELNVEMKNMIRRFKALPKHKYFIAQLKENDELSKIPSIGSKTLSEQLPYFFDLVFALRTTVPGKDGKINRILYTRGDSQWLGNDSSGKLDSTEPADLSAIKQKILGDTQ